MTITATIAATIAWMLTTYEAHSAADEYWFAFVIDHLTYVVPHMTFEALTAFIKPDFTSHKKGHKFILRIRANADQCRALIPNAILLGDENVLTRKVRNAGDGLEQILSERFGDGTWTKHDSTQFWIAGDLVIDGKQVQVKRNDATLASEQCLRNNFG